MKVFKFYQVQCFYCLLIYLSYSYYRLVKCIGCWNCWIDGEISLEESMVSQHGRIDDVILERCEIFFWSRHCKLPRWSMLRLSQMAIWMSPVQTADVVFGGGGLFEVRHRWNRCQPMANIVLNHFFNGVRILLDKVLGKDFGLIVV